jgi:hypothetical protein
VEFPANFQQFLRWLGALRMTPQTLPSLLKAASRSALI